MGSHKAREIAAPEIYLPEGCAIRGSIVVADSMWGGRQIVDELHREGFAVCHVSSVRLALAAIERLRPDLLVTELKLDDGSGFELLTETSRLNASIRVLVATAYGSIESAYASISAGAVDYITKPVSAQQVLASWLPRDTDKPVWPNLEETRRDYIREMLAQYASIARTAQVLRLDRRSLRRMMGRLQLCKENRGVADGHTMNLDVTARRAPS